MAVITFNRQKRAAPPPMPRGDLLLEAPPEIPPPATGGGIGTILRMLPMVAGAGAMALMMTSGMMGGGTGRGVLGGVMGAMYGVSMLGMMMSQTGRGNDDQAQQLDANRRDYFRYLGQIRRKVRHAADAQRRSFLWRHPAPDMLWTIAGERRMWERRMDNDDFASVRVSVGPQQFAQRIQPPESKPIEDLEPLTTGAVRRFIRTHKVISGAPVAINLRSYRHIRMVGDTAAQRGLAFAMVAQLAAWHAPTELRIMLCVAPEHRAEWDWVKWLPHLQHPSREDGLGSVRLFATSTLELASVSDGAAVNEGGDAAHVVLVVDGVDGVRAESFVPAGTTTSTIELTTLKERPRRIDSGAGVLEVQPDKLILHRRDPNSGQLIRTDIGKPDSIPMVYAEMLARQLSPYRMPVLAAGVSEDDEGDAPVAVFEPPKDYPAMVGTGDPVTMDVREAWKPRPRHMRLRIPFGTGEDGRPVELDIKESALGGMGPHGLCIGATGSGKSEFLRTLVLGLAMTHSSEQLNFVLVDFKGGATFLGLEHLPHVSAVITNLEGELLLVDRMQDAIAGEMERRMEVLRAAGNFKNREDYEEARQHGADMPPMPSLFMVVDEFSELLTPRPEFIDLFLQIGRIGRSVAVHLLLASQRLEENKLRGLDTYLSYRIALRTFSPAESRTVIGVPDAYELPAPPGNGYLKFDTVSMVRFKAAYVSGPWTGSSASATSDAGARRTGGGTDALGQAEWVPPVLQFVPGHVDVIEPPQPEVVEELPASLDEVLDSSRAEEAEDEEPETLLSVVVNRLKGHGWPAHQVWLPPLDDPPAMDQLFGVQLAPVEGRGLTTVDPRYRGTLNAPVALVDRPRQQRRDPMWLDLSGSGGNLAIVGGPQSGKSTAVRALIAGLSLTHTPHEVGFYCLDFGGGSLLSMRDLVHVGSVCARLDVDRVRRTVAEMSSLMQSREIAFAELGIDGIATYRRGRRDGTIEPDRFPTDVFLVVDGWMTLRQEFEAQEQPIANMAARGLGYGLHVIATGNKWADFRINIRDMLQSRVELKLGDAFESEINRKIQAVVPKGRPGRGISNDSLHMLVALPRIDGKTTVDDVTEGQRDMIGAINGAWQGPRAADVRMLPDDLSFTALPRVTMDGHNRTIPIGIDEMELAPVWFDPAAEPHLVIFGAPECGKSTALRVILRGIQARYTPKEAKIALLDYRRSLLGEVEGEHLLQYAASAAASTQLITDIAAALKVRLPGPELTQQQLRDKSWWKGADVFVVVNDYELASTPMNHALTPLAEYVSQASDIGLHIIIARGMGGAGRAVFGDAIVSRMKDAQTPALIMSGTKDEGALFGDVKPQPLPVGRGTWVTRGYKGLVQVANLEAKG